MKVQPYASINQSKDSLFHQPSPLGGKDKAGGIVNLIYQAFSFITLAFLLNSVVLGAMGLGNFVICVGEHGSSHIENLHENECCSLLYSPHSPALSLSQEFRQHDHKKSCRTCNDFILPAIRAISCNPITVQIETGSAGQVISDYSCRRRSTAVNRTVHAFRSDPFFRKSTVLLF